MRIPTSVIVMSLLTAAPFGMAIRDTLTKKQPADVLDEDEYRYGTRDHRDARRDREALEQYEREMAREAEERARKREEALAVLDKLYGSQPASLGSLFDGIVIGADAGNFQPDAARRRIDRASRDGYVSVSFDVDQTALRGVTVHISGADYSDDVVVEPCDRLRDQLVAAWGPSNNGAWLDPATHQRAHLASEDECALTFTRYLEAAEWVAALPFDAIGKNTEKYLEKVPTAEVDDDGALWYLPGVGAGTSPTQIILFSKNGKVTGFTASSTTDFDSLVAVREGMSAKLKGQPKLDDDYGDTWRWKTKVPAELTKGSGGRLELSVGRDPWD